MAWGSADGPTVSLIDVLQRVDQAMVPKGVGGGSDHGPEGRIPHKKRRAAVVTNGQNSSHQPSTQVQAELRFTFDSSQ
jgi:hypothetical protein